VKKEKQNTTESVTKGERRTEKEQLNPKRALGLHSGCKRPVFHKQPCYCPVSVLWRERLDVFFVNLRQENSHGRRKCNDLVNNSKPEILFYHHHHFLLRIEENMPRTIHMTSKLGYIQKGSPFRNEVTLCIMLILGESVAKVLRYIIFII